MIDDKPKEACGIIGVFGHPEAAKLCYLGLYALQHRGQESAGIVSSDGERFYTHRGQGLVNDVLAELSQGARPPPREGARGNRAYGRGPRDGRGERRQ